VTLLSRVRFGQTLMNYTFNSAGQLASFTDGNSHATGLSNYKRGIPQTISYPDSTSVLVMRVIVPAGAAACTACSPRA